MCATYGHGEKVKSYAWYCPSECAGLGTLGMTCMHRRILSRNSTSKDNIIILYYGGATAQQKWPLQFFSTEIVKRRSHNSIGHFILFLVNSVCTKIQTFNGTWNVIKKKKKKPFAIGKRGTPYLFFFSFFPRIKQKLYCVILFLLYHECKSFSRYFWTLPAGPSGPARSQTWDLEFFFFSYRPIEVIKCWFNFTIMRFRANDIIFSLLLDPYNLTQPQIKTRLSFLCTWRKDQICAIFLLQFTILSCIRSNCIFL